MKKIKLLVVMMICIFCITGCMRFNTTIEVKSNGKVDVSMLLAAKSEDGTEEDTSTSFEELEKEGCELEMIAGGCDYDCHMRRFRTKLISMAMRGFDRVIVEPSGIFDVDEFFDILHDEPLDRWYEAGSVIAICDAGLPDRCAERLEQGR